jgi:hypothetical protein
VIDIRKDLPPLPARMQHLRIDDRGYPVPWFVAWIDGKPDFRVADGDKLRRALSDRSCWLCGERVGKKATFVIGPMCAVNRTTAEPPCHLECAQYAASACPFLRLPKAKRNESNLPDVANLPAGEMIKRNPGVTLLWTTDKYTCRQYPNGILFRLHEEPLSVEWYAQGRLATRQEVMDSIDSGLPILQEHCADAAELEALTVSYSRTMPLLPAAA